MTKELKTALQTAAIKEAWERNGSDVPDVTGQAFGKLVSAEVGAGARSSPTPASSWTERRDRPARPGRVAPGRAGPCSLRGPGLRLPGRCEMRPRRGGRFAPGGNGRADQARSRARDRRPTRVPARRLPDERNLSDDGRADARRLGVRLKAERVAVATVRSSRWCRALETAALAFPDVPVTPEPVLDSGFGESGGSSARTRQAAAIVADWAGRVGTLVRDASGQHHGSDLGLPRRAKSSSSGRARTA